MLVRLAAAALGACLLCSQALPVASLEAAERDAAAYSVSSSSATPWAETAARKKPNAGAASLAVATSSPAAFSLLRQSPPIPPPCRRPHSRVSASAGRGPPSA